jgi:hypothetical protein
MKFNGKDRLTNYIVKVFGKSASNLTPNTLLFSKTYNGMGGANGGICAKSSGSIGGGRIGGISSSSSSISISSSSSSSSFSSSSSSSISTSVGAVACAGSGGSSASAVAGAGFGG